MDPSHLAQIQKSLDNSTAIQISKSFMTKNILFSKRNFGDQADNATGILMYITFFPEYNVS